MVHGQNHAMVQRGQSGGTLSGAGPGKSEKVVRLLAAGDMAGDVSAYLGRKQVEDEARRVGQGVPGRRGLEPVVESPLLRRWA